MTPGLGGGGENSVGSIFMLVKTTVAASFSPHKQQTCADPSRWLPSESFRDPGVEKPDVLEEH